MKLEEFLSQKRSRILKDWLDDILETYPSYSNRFLKNQKDPFANPIRHNISTEIESLFNEIAQGNDIERDRVAPAIDTIVRIRAVQDFSASGAIGFIFHLKSIIREELNDEIQEHELEKEMIAVESKIDDLALIAVDILMQCREKIFELKARHMENQLSGLLRRTGLVCEIPEWEPLPDEDNNNHQAIS